MYGDACQLAHAVDLAQVIVGECDLQVEMQHAVQGRIGARTLIGLAQRDQGGHSIHAVKQIGVQ